MFFRFLHIEFLRAWKYKQKLLSDYFFLSILIVLQYSVYVGLGNQTEALLPYILISSTLSSSLLTYRFPKFVQTFQKGEIAKYFLFPFHVWKTFLYEDLAESISIYLQHAFFLILALICMYPTLLTGILFCASTCMSLYIATVISELFYSLSFLLKNFSASKALLTGISSLFSGALIPLVLLPDFFVEICYYTPFAMLVDAPIQILIHQHYLLLVPQIIWACVISILSYKAVDWCLYKTEVHGG